MLTIPVFGQGNQDERLWKSYTQKSKEELRLFFKNWSTEITPITDAELNALNDTLRQAYHAFKTFYHPKDNDKIGGSEWGNDIYRNSEYLIVQSKMKIGFITTLNEDSVIHNNVKRAYRADTAMQNKLLKKVDGKYQPNTIRFFSDREEETIVDSITNFRPQIEKAVFLTDQYSNLLNKFLGNKYYKLGTGGVMNPAKAKGESKRRLDFMNQVVTIFQGHWGGYWVLVTHPQAYNIIFDIGMKNALVNYKMVYEGGEVLLERQADNDWKIVKARRTWIE